VLTVPPDVAVVVVVRVLILRSDFVDGQAAGFIGLFNLLPGSLFNDLLIDESVLQQYVGALPRCLLERGHFAIAAFVGDSIRQRHRGAGSVAHCQDVDSEPSERNWAFLLTGLSC
jgi:hypothetical protein